MQGRCFFSVVAAFQELLSREDKAENVLGIP